MSNNYMILLKRVSAYLIDIFIVFLFGVVISSISFFDKYKEEYSELNNEFKEVIKSNDDFINLFKENYIDGIISQEEYDKLILMDDYKEILTSKYDDSEITKKEYQTIIKDANKIYFDKELEFNYKISRVLTYNSVITLSIMLTYFGVLQFTLKGQTIGKKIMNLRVVSINKNKLSLGLMLVRSLIVNNVFLNSINLFCLWFLNKNIYNNVIGIIDTLISIIEAIIIYLIIVRSDARGLHDLIAKTKVVFDEKKNDDKIIEGKYVEK